MKKRMIKMGERDDYDDPLDIMEDLCFQQTLQKADGTHKKRIWDHSGTRPLPFFIRKVH